ncbi:MAG: carbon-nitrogen hydrolase family protein [Planctomycetales bacterium]|nr:carbon-nitrogen hydrolase family protein [Planctomycetales bacterium]
MTDSPLTSVAVAGVQMDIAFGNVSSNLQRIEGLIHSPQLATARLVVFPECTLTGYCYESKDEAWPVAEKIPGPTTQAVIDLARSSNKYLVVGMLERDGKDLFNALILVGPNGIVGKYRKVHLPYLGVDRFTSPGNDCFPVFDLGFLKLGLAICYDGSFPESIRVLALSGADLVALPTNWPPGSEVFAEHLPSVRAMENHIYFLTVNRVGIEREFEFIGQSKFCIPTGRIVASAGATEESVLLSTVLPAIARQKRLERLPGKHSIDRWADRRPEMYASICNPKQ